MDFLKSCFLIGQVQVEGPNGQHAARSGTSMEKTKKPLPILAAPDIAQMTPFKPTFNWIPGQHRIPGGIFPIPPLAAELLTKLPPPDCFNGPYVILDQLLRTMSNINLNPAILLGNDVTGIIFKMIVKIIYVCK